MTWWQWVLTPLWLWLVWRDICFDYEALARRLRRRIGAVRLFGLFALLYGAGAVAVAVFARPTVEAVVTMSALAAFSIFAALWAFIAGKMPDE